ncbi:MAG: hypothetical protein ACYCX2_05685 [Christensenellales bacterium]
MRKCAVCGTPGGIDTDFFIWQTSGSASNCIGIGSCSICYDCVKKRLLRSPKATVITGFIFLLFPIFLAAIPSFVKQSVITPVIICILFFLALCFLIVFLGRRNIKKFTSQCDNKISSSEAESAAGDAALKYFRKIQQVPAENVDLNFESFWENNKLQQIVFAYKTAKSDEEKAKIISCFLNECTRQPIDSSKGKLGFYVLRAMPDDDVCNFLRLAHKAWLLANASPIKK